MITFALSPSPSLIAI